MYYLLFYRFFKKFYFLLVDFNFLLLPNLPLWGVALPPSIGPCPTIAWNFSCRGLSILLRFTLRLNLDSTVWLIKRDIPASTTSRLTLFPRCHLFFPERRNSIDLSSESSKHPCTQIHSAFSSKATWHVTLCSSHSKGVHSAPRDSFVRSRLQFG